MIPYARLSVCKHRENLVENPIYSSSRQTLCCSSGMKIEFSPLRFHSIMIAVWICAASCSIKINFPDVFWWFHAERPMFLVQVEGPCLSCPKSINQSPRVYNMIFLVTILFYHNKPPCVCRISTSQFNPNKAFEPTGDSCRSLVWNSSELEAIKSYFSSLQPF